MNTPPLHAWSRGQTDSDVISAATLSTRIGETVAWTRHILTVENARPSMRTPEISPQLLHSGYDDVICDVGSNRRYKLQQLNIDEMPINHASHRGRFLCFFPDANLTDGAAEQETDGFFDAYNNPPWDTWVGFFNDRHQESISYRCYVLCFVPHDLIPLVDRGIIVNPEECIQWIESTDLVIGSILQTL
ncbi:hypothetical protein OAG71_00555 [bacterium]|nr:hypothetical protein [bacterium]